MTEVEQLEKRIEELESELKEAKDEISDNEDEIDDLERHVSRLEDDVYEKEQKLELYENIKYLNTERMIDRQKLELFAEHFEHITLEDIENLLKQKKRI